MNLWGLTWNDGIKSLLMGVQGSMWTEFCNRTSDVEYMLFPGWRLWLKWGGLYQERKTGPLSESAGSFYGTIGRQRSEFRPINV